MEKLTDVIVIGAGAAGLMAAADLAKAGKSVLILEARSEPGGRILAATFPGLALPVHLGAEFIHGHQPLTLQLLREAKALVTPMAGHSYEFRNGKISPEPADQHWEEFEQRLEALNVDLSVDEFLNRHFAESKYRELRRAVRSFVMGYDAADPARASMFALKEEWKNEAVNLQARGGYLPMIEVLMNTATSKGVSLRFSSVVKQIRWKTGDVEVSIEGGPTFHGRSALITVPLGVLTAHHSAPAAITFVPPVTEKIRAAEEIGFGSVIKFALKFRSRFWETATPDLGFLLSDLAVPTWWLQRDNEDGVLVGWLAGPAAETLRGVSTQALLSKALATLSQLFRKTEQYLRSDLENYQIYNWLDDPFSAGAYSYTLAGHLQSRQRLGEPLENTLYFAGEAVYEGPAGGTVEAALQSGIDAALQILLNIAPFEKRKPNIVNTKTFS